MKQFQTEHDERHIILLFKADRFEGTLQSSDEGEAMWVERSNLPNEYCSPNFDLTLRSFEDDSVSEFFYDGETSYFL